MVVALGLVVVAIRLPQTIAKTASDTGALASLLTQMDVKQLTAEYRGSIHTTFEQFDRSLSGSETNGVSTENP